MVILLDYYRRTISPGASDSEHMKYAFVGAVCIRHWTLR